MGPNAFTAARSLRRDQSVKSAKIAKGTARRILTYVRPYRRLLIFFLVLVVIDAVVSAANPLLYRAIIDKGILGKDAGLIVWLAVLVAVLALSDAALTLAERYISARVGEGLIYDLRTQVFDHVQRMPLAFFTRTQTGALVSRLNNDVHRRPGGVHRRPLHGDRQPHQRRHRAGDHVLPVAGSSRWSSLILLPVFLLPARWLGRKLQAITRERYELLGEMNTTMVERFNVSGALLVKLFGHPEAEDAELPRASGPRARHRHHASRCTPGSSSSRCSSPRRSPPPSSTAGAACSPCTARSPWAPSSRSPPTSTASTGRSPRSPTSTSTS